MSGFVLSFSCLIKCNEIDYLRVAINKRFLRLAIPVSGSILISYFLMNLSMFSYSNIDIVSPLVNAYSKTPSVTEFIKAFFYESIIFGDGKFNYVLWTINIELFGSFFVYFLLISIGYDIRKIRFVSFCILILALFLQNNTFIIYMGLFSVGIFMSTFILNKPNKTYNQTYALLVIVFGLYLWGYSWNSASYEYLANLLTKIQNEFNLVIYWPIIIPSIGATLILSSIFVNAKVLATLNKNIFTTIGKYSFSIYLIHTFVLAIIAPKIYLLNTNNIIKSFITAFLTICITLFVSKYYYQYIDKKTIEILRK